MGSLMHKEKEQNLRKKLTPEQSKIIMNLINSLFWYPVGAMKRAREWLDKNTEEEKCKECGYLFSECVCDIEDLLLRKRNNKNK